MKTVSVNLVAISTLSFLNCAALNEAHKESAFEQVKKIATFDLDCPVSGLDMQVLDESCELGECTPYEVGVIGCGKRTRYTYVKGRWIANYSTEKK